MAGYALVIFILAAGMVFALQKLDTLTTSEVALIQEKEREITDAERLRWTGELIVSAGRGYLITGDPTLRTRLEDAESDFDREVRELTHATLSEHGRELVTEAERAADEFRVSEHMKAQKSELAG